MPDDRLHNEKELLLQMAAGDENAFNAVYEHYWQKIYSYIEPVVKNAAIAEEMVIDIFLVLWRSREQLPGIENLGGFLRTVSRNKALDFLKTTARQRQREQAYRAAILFRMPATPQDTLLDKEIIKTYNDCIANLSPQRQKIFLMHREEGLTYDQIAEKLKISPTTAKKSFFDALNAIKKYLETRYPAVSMLLFWTFLKDFLE